MAKRFIDTSFYKSHFVRSLKGSLKGLYSYIICDCSGAGIWVKDLEIASLYIGFEIGENDFEIFVKSGKAIELKSGIYFFPDFIEHQYPQGLSEKNPAQKNIISELKKFNLIDDDLKVVGRPFEGTIEGTMVIYKEKVIVKEKESVEKNQKNEIPELEEVLSYLSEFIKSKNLLPSDRLKIAMESKYQSWVENKWKDGNGNKISNWKTKIQNTLEFMPAYKELHNRNLKNEPARVFNTNR